MQRVELNIGSEEEKNTLQFVGEELDRVEDNETKTTLYSHKGGYLVYEETKTFYRYFAALHPNPEYNYTDEIFEPSDIFYAAEIMEHYPVFGEVVVTEYDRLGTRLLYPYTSLSVYE